MYFKEKKALALLLVAVSGVSGCMSKDTAVMTTMPLSMIDGLVTVVTLGTIYPGAGATVADLLSDGQLNSHVYSPLLEREDSPLRTSNPEYEQAVYQVASGALGKTKSDGSTILIEQSESLGLGKAPEKTAPVAMAPSSEDKPELIAKSREPDKKQGDFGKAQAADPRCVAIQEEHGLTQLVSKCNEKINVVFCVDTLKSSFSCGRKSSYGMVTLTLDGPPQFIPFYKNDGRGEIRYAACVYPHLPQFNPRGTSHCKFLKATD